MKTVLDYENTRLEQKHPDLRCLVRDYGNRLLADKITEQEIRKRAATDEAGLQAYFESTVPIISGKSRDTKALYCME